MPRCCVPIPDEFTPSYASVLVAPDLQAAVQEVERGMLLPCITAWCYNCRRPYLLTSSSGAFHSISAHHAHMITIARRQTGAA